MRLIVVCVSVVAVVSACSNANNGSPHAPPHEEEQSRARAAETHQSHAVVDAPFDLRFLDTMTEHHRQGVQMAEIALQRAKHVELRQFASKMKDDQTTEIAEMARVREKSFFEANPAVDHALDGMASMPQMNMSKLQQASGDEFDHQFIDGMIDHHQAAVTMARDASERASLPEARAMATKMADMQSKEIERLKGWRSSWFHR